MKRALSIALALIMLLALAACGTEQVKETQPSETQGEASAPAESAAAETPKGSPEASGGPEESQSPVLLSAESVWEYDFNSDGESGAQLYGEDDFQSYGPCDFYVDGETVYILNSAANAVTVYVSGKAERYIELDGKGINGMQLGVNGGDIYVLGVNHEDNGLALVRIDKDGVKHDTPFTEFAGGAAAAVSLDVFGGKLYLSTDEGAGGSTYVFDLSDENAEQNYTSVDGAVLSDGTRYVPNLTPEGGFGFGQTASIAVTHTDGETTDISVTTEHILGGIGLVGVFPDGSCCVRVVEVILGMDYTDYTSVETFVLFGKDGEYLGGYEAPEETVNTGRTVKLFGGELYILNTLEDTTEVVRMDESWFKA